MTEDEKSKTLGKFKIRLLELEDPVEHTLTHASVCELVNEFRREFLESQPKFTPEMIEPAKKSGDRNFEAMAKGYECFMKWFGTP